MRGSGAYLHICGSKVVIVHKCAQALVIRPSFVHSCVQIRAHLCMKMVDVVEGGALFCIYVLPPEPGSQSLHQGIGVGNSRRRWSRLSATLPPIQFNIKKNIHQGFTPLLLAASTGLADVVQLLCNRGANTRQLDKKGRGILQLAKGCQRDRASLYHWLLEKDPGLPLTNAKGRSDDQKQRGEFSKLYRDNTTPWKKKRSWSKQEWQDWNQWEDWK